MSAPDSRMARTLIADDQPDVLAALRLLLKGEGFQTEAVTSPAAVLEALEAGNYDLLLMDLNYARDTTSGQEGLDLLTRVQAIDNTLPIVVMTAWGTVDLAVEAMRQGVRDFVQKPWENAHLLKVLRAQIEQGKALRKKRRLAAEIKDLKDAALETPDLQTLLNLFASRIQEALQNRSVAIFTRNSTDEAFEVAAQTGFDDGALDRLKLNGESLLLNMTDGLIDASRLTSPDDERSNIMQAGIELLASVRLKGELKGFIAVGGKQEDEEYDGEERKFLALAADQLGLDINGSHLRGQGQEVEEAREIQRGLLPKTIPQIPGYEISASWRPARAVSGDYFDALKFSESKIALAVADVSGKGMPAALLMSNVQAVVKAFASQEIAPRELCEKVNRIICNNTGPEKFITFFYCLLDAESNTLVYANAGHNAPMLVRRDGEVERLEEGGAIFGPLPEWNYEQGEATLQSGDRVLLFTDGVTEARNSAGEEFGEERLIDLLVKNRHLEADELQEKIMRAVTEFSGGHFQDDVTLMALAAR